jgi:MarR family transcriptional regulator, organic hydroperoxide resistance regulator
MLTKFPAARRLAGSEAFGKPTTELVVGYAKEMSTEATAGPVTSDQGATPEPPASFGAALDHFFSALRRSRARAAREAGTGELTVPQYLLLGALTECPERPVGELAECAGVAAPTATRMIAGLERAGVVERRHSTTDRRVVTVRLTANGRRLLERKQQMLSDTRRALYASLTAAERRQVEALLVRLADVIEEL